MDPQAKIHVPESARKDKVHRHIWKYDSPSYDYERILCDCGKVLEWDEMIRRLNVLEDMLTWPDGIYTGTQIRDFARLICDPTSIGS